jgi:hypothetical protein
MEEASELWKVARRCFGSSQAAQGAANQHGESRGGAASNWRRRCSSVRSIGGVLCCVVGVRQLVWSFCGMCSGWYAALPESSNIRASIGSVHSPETAWSGTLHRCPTIDTSSVRPASATDAKTADKHVNVHV